MNFLPISILAYVFNAGSIIIDKVLLQKSLPNPIIYAFYISVLGLLAIVLIPFGFTLQPTTAVILAAASGVIFVGALYTMFTALKKTEATLVGPVVGSLNPLFSVIIGGVFLNQILTNNQYYAIATLIFGAFILAIPFNKLPHNGTIISKYGIATNWLWMILSGFLFGLSYVLLKEAFLETTFINGLIISRLGAGIFAASFLLFPNLRKQIFHKQQSIQKVNIKHVAILLTTGQLLGAAQGLMLTYAVSLANPALVNSLFGVQYVVILAAAVFLYKNHPNLLDERITKGVIMQKIIGVIILSGGLYLLAK